MSKSTKLFSRVSDVNESGKGGFFFRKCDSFFRYPNLKKKIFQKNYPELEI